jgi:hypothetical protein
MLLPLAVGVLVVLHVILVRRHGVVPPFDAVPPDAGGALSEPTEQKPAQAEAAEAGAAAPTSAEPAGVAGSTP